MGNVKFVYWEDTPYDALLIMNGCVSACATYPDYYGPTFVAAGNTLAQLDLTMEQVESFLKKFSKSDLH